MISEGSFGSFSAFSTPVLIRPSRSGPDREGSLEHLSLAGSKIGGRKSLGHGSGL